MTQTSSPEARLFVFLGVAIALSGVWGCASSPTTGEVMRRRSAATAQVPARTGEVRTIVIDAGHGGKDPGTSHYGLKEKALVLDMARRLRTLLEGTGLAVVMTRETDVFIPLSGRAAVANRLNADLFVSIHVNANPHRSVSGIEVYYPRQSTAVSSNHWPPGMTVNEIGTPSTTVNQVLWDLVLRKSRVRSRRLASSMCNAMRSGLSAPCRGIKPARFVVLREARMPAVLVEVGYVTNRDEASRLASPDYRQAAARAMTEGILSYIGQVNAQQI